MSRTAFDYAKIYRQLSRRFADCARFWYHQHNVSKFEKAKRKALHARLWSNEWFVKAKL